MTAEANRKPKNNRDNPCVVCNNSEFSWGKLSVGETLKEERLTVFFRLEGSKFEDGDIPTYVRYCEICGNILLFAVES